jgi:hypothetical protein
VLENEKSFVIRSGAFAQPQKPTMTAKKDVIEIADASRDTQ